MGTGFGRNLRSRVFGRVTGFSLHEFDKLGTATLITRTTNDMTQVQQVMLIILRMMITAPLMAIGGIIMALSKDRPLTLVLVVAVPVLVAAIILILQRAVPLFQVMQNKLDRVNLVLREGLTGIRVIRAFNRVDYEQRRFDAANTDLTDNAIRSTASWPLLMPVMILVHEPDQRRHHLVRRHPHRQRRDAGRRADRLPAVRDADHVLAC